MELSFSTYVIGNVVQVSDEAHDPLVMLSVMHVYFGKWGNALVSNVTSNCTDKSMFLALNNYHRHWLIKIMKNTQKYDAFLF